MSTLYNHLQGETSPYLLQHVENPVDWYPWGEEAFQRAREEQKPVFLSIGYSTCHWCHVMAHESFEDAEIAALLNRYFVAVKVDKEERPDIDSIYMTVCQALTGSGGWPTSVFMTPDQRPFFAGTYFPKDSRRGMIGLRDLLTLVHERWEDDREALLRQGMELMAQLGQSKTGGKACPELLETAVELYKRSYDRSCGGFGRAPKFPAPHNLLFLLTYYERCGDPACLEMAEHTLVQLYRGGIFDHIGFGFCRYSTDRQFLIPHFEKMLYDNALLILAYCKAYTLTKKDLQLLAAERTAQYILREMTSPEGGFYSAQDADSGGGEGNYYLFTPAELTGLLGETDGAAFNQQFDISPVGNFEGKSIPNLLHSDPEDRSFDRAIEPVYQYRRQRCTLPLDDKILTAWNGLMIAALCRLYQDTGASAYLEAAKRADRFIQEHLCQDGTLFVSMRAGKRGVRGFLDDYASYLFAQLALYHATLERSYLDRAEVLCQAVNHRFLDREKGGYYFYDSEHEALILRPKETYDGAIPSGNALMAWNLVRLSQLVPTEAYRQMAEHQLNFLAGDAEQYPPGYAMFLLALLDQRDPPPKVTIAGAEQMDWTAIPLTLPSDTIVVLRGASDPDYPLIAEAPTFYLCQGRSCLPPTNHLDNVIRRLKPPV